MRFIVHVIDDASQHEKMEDGKYGIASGLTDDNATCDIMRTDGWYTTEANTPLDAVAILSNTIEVKNKDGEMILLSKSFTETHKSNSTTDFSSDNAERLIDDMFVKIITNSYSEYYMASCQIPMEVDDQKWIELHKVHFYIVEDVKLIEV